MNPAVFRTTRKTINYYRSNGECTISKLPDDVVVNTVMVFLQYKDRNTVAATCITLCKDVESFSKMNLPRWIECCASRCFVGEWQLVSHCGKRSWSFPCGRFATCATNLVASRCSVFLFQNLLPSMESSR
jgi:hypothetical protein